MTVYASDGTPYYSVADKEAGETYKQMTQTNRLKKEKEIELKCVDQTSSATKSPLKLVVGILQNS